MKRIFDIALKQEVSRCLLCYDAPCSRACPAKHQPDRVVRSLFLDNPSGAVRWMQAGDRNRPCPEGCQGANSCQKACIRQRLDRAIDLPMVREYLSENIRPHACEEVSCG